MRNGAAWPWPTSILNARGPPFLSATAVGVRGQSPPEADDILALEHTFFALSCVVFE